MDWTKLPLLSCPVALKLFLNDIVKNTFIIYYRTLNRIYQEVVKNDQISVLGSKVT